jgi:hypothetical protein
MYPGLPGKTTTVMAFTVIKLGDEPIILLAVDFSVPSWLQNLQSLKAQVMHYASGAELPLYVILNLHHQDVTASDIQLLIYDAEEAPDGSLVDARLRPVVVSDHPLVEMLQRKLHDEFGVMMPKFEDTESALEWVRAQFSEEGV